MTAVSTHIAAADQVSDALQQSHNVQLIAAPRSRPLAVALTAVENLGMKMHVTSAKQLDNMAAWRVFNFGFDTVLVIEDAEAMDEWLVGHLRNGQDDMGLMIFISSAEADLSDHVADFLADLTPVELPAR